MFALIVIFLETGAGVGFGSGFGSTTTGGLGLGGGGGGGGGLYPGGLNTVTPFLFTSSSDRVY